MPVKVMRIDDASVKIMRWDRGETLRLVDDADGAKDVDVHINLINVDSGPGPTHYHAKVEHFYIVLEGTVQAIVERKKYRLGSGEIAFIPPGVKHAAGNAGDNTIDYLEILSRGRVNLDDTCYLVPAAFMTGFWLRIGDG